MARKRTTSADSATIDTIVRDCIAVRMRLLNRVVTNLYDDALRPLGLKVSQLNVLVATAKLGLARPSKVCGILHLEVSTLSRNVERMEARSWLEMMPDSDARAQPFRLTEKGRQLLEKALPLWARAQRQATKLLGDQTVEMLHRASGRLGFVARDE